MKAVFLTAGAAGMYCGSCMHDNALARAMRAHGVDCVLQPVYTPIRTDVESVAGDRVFFGGIHIYLLQQMPWLRHVPAPIRRALDWTPLIRLVTARSHSTSSASLGDLTISMLQGVDGRQADEVTRLVDWLADEMRPNAIVLSNLLIGGAIPAIRRRLPKTKLVVLLQGDDIFLDHLPQPQRDQVLSLLKQLVQYIDCFVVHSRFYADKMGAMLAIPADKLVVTPLSIDTKPFDNAGAPTESKQESFRLGYLARIAPEKGLHRLVDAFIRMASDPRHDDLSLHVAGWLGASNRDYLRAQTTKISDAGLSDRFEFHDSPTLEDKIDFLRSLDLMCVPTDYEEPKGLFVLESLAAGVPVVQPRHGAFPELIESTGGGLLAAPGDLSDLCSAIERLKENDVLRSELAQTGHQRVHDRHTIGQAAQAMQEILFGSTNVP